MPVFVSAHNAQRCFWSINQTKPVIDRGDILCRNRDFMLMVLTVAHSPQLHAADCVEDIQICDLVTTISYGNECLQHIGIHILST